MKITMHDAMHRIIKVFIYHTKSYSKKAWNIVPIRIKISYILELSH